MYRVLLFLLFGVWSNNAHAGADTLYRLAFHYTDADGLPQNSIKSIDQDFFGFIWLATERGLVRFDGQWFKTFFTSKLESHSDRYGHIIHDDLLPTLMAFNDRQEFFGINPTGLTKDSSYLHKLRRELEWFPGLPDFRRFNLTGIPANDNGRLCFLDSTALIGSRSRYYMVTADRINVYENRAYRYTIPAPRLDAELLFELNGQLYYLNPDNRIGSFTNGKMNLEFIPGLPAAAGKKTRLLWNSNHRDRAIIFVGDQAYLLYHNNGRLTARKIISGFDAAKEQIITVWIDPGGKRILLGSHLNGLFVFESQLFQTVASTRDNIADPVYYAQGVWNNNWILTGQGFLFKPSESAAIERKLPFPHRSNKYGLVIDNDQWAWTRMDSQVHQFQLPEGKLLQSWSFQAGVTGMASAGNGKLWIGTENGSLIFFDSRNEAMPAAIQTQLPFFATVILKRDEQSLWLGTGSGVFSYAIQTKQLESIPGLQGRQIRSILMMGPDELWVTTYGHGFYLYKNKELTSFPLDQKQYLETAHCIAADSSGYFWVTTNRGLFQMSRKDLLDYAAGRIDMLYYHYYSTAQGLLTTEFNGGCQPCAVQMDNGMISFPTINGLVWFNPAGFSPELPFEPVFIDRLLIDNDEHAVVNNLELPRNFQQVKVFISSPYMGNKDNLFMQYAIVKKGAKPVWITEENNIISISNLPAGEYEVRIRKVRGFGENNYREWVLAFTVPAHWMLHPVMLVLYGVLAVLFTFLAIQWRTRYIKRKNTQLQQLVQKQTAELHTTLHDLRQSQQELMRQADWQQKMLAVLSHDIKAPLKYLMFTADHIQKGLQQEGGSAYIEHTQTVNDYIRRLYHSMDSLLQYVQAQLRDGQVTLQQLDVSKLVEDRKAIFQDIAGRVQTRIENNVPPGFMAYSNAALLAVIIHNLIDNAVKVTEHGVISISAWEQAGTYIRISDTGIGMEPALAAWLSNSSGEQQQQVSREGKSGGSGIGLLIVKGLTEYLKIGLQVDSNDQGTTVTLYLPPASAS